MLEYPRHFTRRRCGAVVVWKVWPRFLNAASATAIACSHPGLLARVPLISVPARYRPAQVLARRPSADRRPCTAAVGSVPAHGYLAGAGLAFGRVLRMAVEIPGISV